MVEPCSKAARASAATTTNAMPDGAGAPAASATTAATMPVGTPRRAMVNVVARGTSSATQVTAHTNQHSMPTTSGQLVAPAVERGGHRDRSGGGDGEPEDHHRPRLSTTHAPRFVERCSRSLIQCARDRGTSSMADHEPTKTDAMEHPAELPFSVGWATSIGSLPHTDPVEAARLVLRTQPDLPAAPSLPQRSPLEGMLPQAMWGMSGIKIDADGAIAVDLGALDPEAPLADPGLEDEPFVGLQTFLREVAGRTSPIKAQLTGAVTLGLALTMYGVDEPLAFRLALHAVRERAAPCCPSCVRRLPEAPLLVVVDEPALVGTAQLGFPLSTNEIIDLVSGVLAVLEPDATTGVHCCGEADWKAILMAGPQVLSLPVGAGVNSGSRGDLGVHGPWWVDRLGRGSHQRPGRRPGRPLLEDVVLAVVRAGAAWRRPGPDPATLAGHPALRAGPARHRPGRARARPLRSGGRVASGAGRERQALGRCLTDRRRVPNCRTGLERSPSGQPTITGA